MGSAAQEISWRERIIEAHTPIRRPPTRRRTFLRAPSVLQGYGRADAVVTRVASSAEDPVRVSRVALSTSNGEPVGRAPYVGLDSAAMQAAATQTPFTLRAGALGASPSIRVEARAERAAFPLSVLCFLRADPVPGAQAGPCDSQWTEPEAPDVLAAALALPQPAVVETQLVFRPLVGQRQAWEELLAFDHPTALRRLLRAPGQLPLFADPGLEGPLVDLLNASSRTEISRKRDLAERAVLCAPGGERVPPRIELVRELARHAGGQGIARGRWGDDAVLDQLRLRALARAKHLRGRTVDVGWVGFLGWAGRWLSQCDLDELPPTLLRVAAASLAASEGYEIALGLLTRRQALPERSPAQFDVRSLLTLRCVVAGRVPARQIDELIPSARILEGRRHSAWASAFAAWHVLSQRPLSAALVRLTAALTSSAFRRRVLRAATRAHSDLVLADWGDPSHPCPDNAGALRNFLERDGMKTPGQTASLIPQGWGGPSADAWRVALEGRLGDPVAARLAMLDDTLSMAASFLLFGMAPSCLATLRGTLTAPVFEHARAALERVAASKAPPAVPSAPPLTFASPERDFSTLVARVRDFPDPNIELRSPYWLLGDARGEAQIHSMKAGDFLRFRRLRELLDHPQIPRQLRPFWLIRSQADTPQIIELAVWLGHRIPQPAEPRWLGFIERQARKVWPEWKTRA